MTFSLELFALGGLALMLAALLLALAAAWRSRTAKTQR